MAVELAEDLAVWLINAAHATAVAIRLQVDQQAHLLAMWMTIAPLSKMGRSPSRSAGTLAKG
jgi:hypothetical protein